MADVFAALAAVFALTFIANGLSGLGLFNLDAYKPDTRERGGEGQASA